MKDADEMAVYCCGCPSDGVARLALADAMQEAGHDATAAVLRSGAGEDSVRSAFAFADGLRRTPDAFLIRAVCEIILPFNLAEQERKRKAREKWEQIAGALRTPNEMRPVVLWEGGGPDA